MRDKLGCADEVVKIIRDGDTVLISGFVGIGTPDEILIALEKRFLQTGKPRNLTLVFAAAPGDGLDRGVNRLAHKGLVKRVIGGHWSLVPKLAELAMKNEIEAYNLPLGCISQMYRVIAGGKPGLRTKVGLNTFVDPRIEGGKVNACTTEDLVSIDYVNGEEWMFYPSFKIDVAILRGTTSDSHGNTTLEREVLKLDVSSSAMAARNSGGVVIVQAERIAERGSLSPNAVLIPGNLVDAVVISAPENHCQTYATPYQHAFSGMMRVPLDQQEPLALDIRKIIARRAAMELPIDGIVNLGIGVPEGVAAVAAEERLLEVVTLTAEAGTIGGFPQSGLDFGAALNPDAIVATNTQFDFYDGGGIDMACLGMAQADAFGNVNVSKFGPRFAGAGGFINISQNAKKIVFSGSFVTGGFNAIVEDGELKILLEGKTSKFIDSVEQITFSGRLAAQRNQEVLYITERCVFKLHERGLELIEVAPGVDVDKDILALMSFKPIVKNVQLMDKRIFITDEMGLRSDFIDAPISKRILITENGELSCNLVGYKIKKQKHIDIIQARIAELCNGLSEKTVLRMTCKHFKIKEKLFDDFAEILVTLTHHYFSSIQLDIKEPFLRINLCEALQVKGALVEIKNKAIVSKKQLLSPELVESKIA